MKKIISAALILMVLSVGQVFATEDEGQKVTKEAYSDVKVAMELLNQATAIVQSGSLTRQKGEMALSLYARAGQLFERAEGIFKAVGMSYVSQNDIDGARVAKESCLKAISEIRQRLATLPV